MNGQIARLALSTWGALGVVAVVFVVAGVLATWLELIGCRRRRRIHIHTHELLTDEVFLREAGIPAEGHVGALRLRAAIAQTMRVAELSIHPGDSWAYISAFVPDGTDLLVGIEMHLEDKPPVRVPKGFWKPLFSSTAAADLTVGHFAHFVAEEWGVLARPAQIDGQAPTT